jgi:thiamine pyrophosphokinase
LVVGPVPDALSPCIPCPFTSLDDGAEEKYNIDPSSLSLFALDLYDIRKDKEEAFEYFM